MQRRSFFIGLAASLAAPAIVRASSLMAINPIDLFDPGDMDLSQASLEAMMSKIYGNTLWVNSTATYNRLIVANQEHTRRILLGSVDKPFSTMRDALRAAKIGDTIMIGSGHVESLYS
jgi:hypothetical protein